MNSNQNPLARFRVTVQMITDKQYQQEQKLADAFYEAGIEMPADRNSNWEVQIPLTDPGIVCFERDIQQLCWEYNNTKWYDTHK